MSEGQNEINEAVNARFEDILMALTIVQNQQETGEFDAAIIRLIGGEQKLVNSFIQIINTFALTGSFGKNYDGYILSNVLKNTIIAEVSDSKAFVGPDTELTREHKSFLANTFMFWIETISQGDSRGVSLRQKFKIIQATHTEEEASMLMLNFVSLFATILNKAWNLSWVSENPNVFVNRFRNNMLAEINK